MTNHVINAQDQRVLTEYHAKMRMELPIMSLTMNVSQVDQMAIMEIQLHNSERYAISIALHDMDLH